MLIPEDKVTQIIETDGQNMPEVMEVSEWEQINSSKFVKTFVIAAQQTKYFKGEVTKTFTLKKQSGFKAASKLKNMLQNDNGHELVDVVFGPDLKFNEPSDDVVYSHEPNGVEAYEVTKTCEKINGKRVIVYRRK